MKCATLQHSATPLFPTYYKFHTSQEMGPAE